MVENDYVMRIIHEMVRTLIKLKRRSLILRPRKVVISIED